MAKSWLCRMGIISAAVSAWARADITPLNQFANSGAGILSAPTNVAVGSNGQVLVTQAAPAAAKVFAADGSYLTTLTAAASGSGDFSLAQPLFAAVGSDGSSYVADSTRQAILVYGSNGVGQMQIGQSQLSAASGLAINSSGTLYVGNGSAVDLYNDVGGSLGSFGASGNGDGQFGAAGAAGIALDSSQADVYVADPSGNRIEAFTSAGVYEFDFGNQSGPNSLASPQSLAVSGTGLVYITQPSSAGLEVFSAGGTFVEFVAATLNGQPFFPSGVAVNQAGMVYVTGREGTSGTVVAERFFDPQSWASGTNTFTNSATGPTSIGVGSGQLLGSSLILNSGRGLVVGATTSVIDGGMLTLSGGSLTTNSLTVDGTSSGASFTMFNGTLTANSVAVSNGGVADFTSPQASVSVAGTISVSGGTSELEVQQYAAVSCAALTLSAGQLLLGGTCDLVVNSSVTNNGTINFTGGELDVHGTLANSSTNSIQGYGTLSTTTGLFNSGSMKLTGPSGVQGTVLNSGTIEISGVLPTVFLGSVTNAGTFTVDPGATAVFDDGVVGNPTNSSLAIGAGGSAILASTQNQVMVLSNLTLAGGTGAWHSQLDLGANDLIVHNGNLSQISDQIAQGLNSANHGYWNGQGIDSYAAAQTTNTALGVELNNNGHGQPLVTTFEGQPVTSSDVLVKYTYFGDANLDGIVNGSDYALLDNGFNNGLTGWRNGDFNYDGVINGDDYTLIDNSFNTQGPVLSAAAADRIDTSVPEPACQFILGGLCAMFLRRRRSFGL